MADIIRIVIKGGSGYGPVDEAYSDKVTVDLDSIKYEYTPVMESEINVPRKWSYKTSSPIFQKLFREAAAAVEAILNWEEEPFVLIWVSPHSRSHTRIKPRPQGISSFREMISKSALPLSSRWCRDVNTLQRYFLHRTTTMKRGEKQAPYDTF